MKEWKISIDTGGTFTDCIAYPPKGDKIYVKVLSSGVIGGSVLAIKAQRSIQLKINVIISNDLFSGYKILIPNLHWQSEILSNSEDVFETKEPLPVNLTPNELIYLTAGEEAPVLATRIATRVALNDDFPPIDFRLGTTRGTNALLEAKGSRTALFVTKGFKDLLEIGTQQRPDLFALNIIKRQALPHLIIEIDEFVDASGVVHQPLNEEQIEACLDKLQSSGCDSVAIAFKNSYINPVHENRLCEAIANNNHLNVTGSAQLYPAIKYLVRAETAVVNAYLAPILDNYINNIGRHISKQAIRIMTSSGALTRVNSFNPKDSLLSGPAGGIVGAANAATAVGFRQVLTIDMGGTSTDVSRYANGYDYVSELQVGDAHLFTQALAIETVAAGGGSICYINEGRLAVGPDSAGANPGPACYGNDGPLTITDLNLLSGRVDPATFGFPIDIRAAKKAFKHISDNLTSNSKTSDDDLLRGFLAIANLKMADAIKKISIHKGFDPKQYKLLGFGGAIGQHICDIADLLGINTILIPFEGSLLSAAGIAAAKVQKDAIKQILAPLSNKESLLEEIDQLSDMALEKLRSDGIPDGAIHSVIIYLRLYGQDTTLDIEFDRYDTLAATFRSKYEDLFGHWVDRDIEVESIKVIAESQEQVDTISHLNSNSKITLETDGQRKILFSEGWLDAKNYNWQENSFMEESVSGPAVFTNAFTSIIINPDWQVKIVNSSLIVEKTNSDLKKETKNIKAVDLALFTNRFKAVAEQMGSLLQRTALSVNIKERLDFSCALLDSHGRLVVNAPHIPVHLGSLGICTRSIIETINLEEGDIVITNHPAYGGSHLPDVTLIAPIFFQGMLIGYVANRAHHAEIGGKAPGSMPADAKNLAEEGVVIPPTLLVHHGEANWPGIRKLLSSSPYPSRSVEDNIADFQAALASVLEGKKVMLKLVRDFGAEKIIYFMRELSSLATNQLAEKLNRLPNNQWQATELLDNGAKISVAIKWHKHLVIDFNGSSPTNNNNLNATEAIVNGAVIYVLKLLIGGDIPLNEGLMKNVDLRIPRGSFLNPHFPDSPDQCPAVVGGNTEVSQRLVDTLLKAFKLAACSQGTMNNFLFGTKEFGYYETICGGTGAGDGFNGADAVHQHMTNTQITDPEILEFRYPIILEQFAVRPNSGGLGKWVGGNGVIRRFKFTKPVTLTFLTQHRKEAPYGLNGGKAGSVGNQFLEKADGTELTLAGIGTYDIAAGECVEILTPGGGGYGTNSQTH